MKCMTALFLVAGLAAGSVVLAADQAPPASPAAAAAGVAPHAPPKEQKSVTDGVVTVEGQKIDYTATAGTLILKNTEGKPTGSMFYVAYVKRGTQDPARRPITFVFNGGPGSSTIWLHMGAFGPQRVVTADHAHTPAAPYALVNNDYSLLDVTDLVFIDAMDTGYSRILGKDRGGVGKKEDFYGMDADVRSFSQFMMQYMSANHRWRSPKYLYGESYGTVRAELMANYLEQKKRIDLNGIVLQSAFTGASALFGSDVQYENTLPTFAAVAWYHHKLPTQPANLETFLQQVEQFAMNQYAVALNAGNTLSADAFEATAQKLHEYTGLSLEYIRKVNLRISLGGFRHELLNDQGLTVGLLDGRFTGPTMDPAAASAAYDPQEAAISSAYVSGFNYYARSVLKFDSDEPYLPETETEPWSRQHVDLMTGRPTFVFDASLDLSQAMKYDPKLQVEVDSGYFDLDLPYSGMNYAINHLKIPKDLQSHIHVKYYPSGHMIYVNTPALKTLHDNTAQFIRSTDNLS